MLGFATTVQRRRLRDKNTLHHPRRKNMEYTTIPDWYEELWLKKFRFGTSIQPNFSARFARDDPVIFAYYMLGIKLRVYQSFILDCITNRLPQLTGDDRKRFIMCLGRQVGKSTLLKVLALWAAYFNKYPSGSTGETKVYVVSRSDDQAKELLEGIRAMLRQGDMVMSQVTRYTKMHTVNWLSKKVCEPNNTQQITFKNAYGKLSFIKSSPPTDNIIGKCLSGETLVLMADGSYQKLKDVDVGEKVMCVDQLHYTTSEVTNKWSSGKKEAFRLTVRSGKNIDATADHRFLTKRGWVKLRDLTKDDYVATTFRTPNSLDTEYDWPTHWLRVCAYLIGDGYIGDSKVSLTNETEELLDEFEQDILDMGYKIRKESKDGKTQAYNVISGLGHGKENKFFTWMKNLGLMGKTSHTKFIPEQIFYMSKYAKAEFLSRLFSTDGWCCDKEIGYCSVSYELIDGVRRMLQCFGIDATVHKRNVKYNGGKNTAHQLSIKSNVDRTTFSKEIGIKSKLGRDRVFGFMDQSKGHDFGDVRFRKVSKIEPIGEIETYDIEVKDQHNFIANNIVTHNSADLLIIDEGAKLRCNDPDNWFNEAANPTTTATGGITIINSTPNGQCYDDETEVFTEDGWKLFKDLKEEDVVFSRNPETGYAERSPIIAYYEDDYEGIMYGTDTENLKVRVTPEHDMVGYFQKSKKRKKVKAEELTHRNTDFWVDTSFNVCEEWKPVLHGVLIPEVELTRGKGKEIKKAFHVNAAKFYRWLGFYLAEGHVANYDVVITQNSGEVFEYYYKLTQDLFGERMNVRRIPHGEKAERIVISSKQLWTVVKDLKKDGLGWFLKQQSNLLNQLWEGYWDGDGNISEGRDRVFVDAKYPKLADDLQYCALRTAGTSRQYPYETCIAVVRCQYKRTKIKTYENYKKYDYKGKVYCVQAKHGEIFVRRKGVPFWCGNSGFFYELFDPMDTKSVHHYYRIWFPYSINTESTYTEHAHTEKERLISEGKQREWEQEYEARFTTQTTAFFESDKVEAGIDPALSQLLSSADPCSIGVDYGMVHSQTVLTVSKGLTTLRQIAYDAGDPGLTWFEDICQLAIDFNAEMIVVDDCPEGFQINNRLIEKFGEFPNGAVMKVSFRRDKVKMFTEYRRKLYDGSVKYPKIKELLQQMKAMQEIQTQLNVKIEKGAGMRDDRVDSEVLSKYPYLDADPGEQVGITSQAWHDPYTVNQTETRGDILWQELNNDWETQQRELKQRGLLK